MYLTWQGNDTNVEIDDDNKLEIVISAQSSSSNKYMTIQGTKSNVLVSDDGALVVIGA